MTWGMINAVFGILSVTVPMMVGKKDQFLGFHQHIELCRAQFESCSIRYNLWATSLGWDGKGVTLSSLPETVREGIRSRAIVVENEAKMVIRRLGLKDSAFSQADEWVENQVTKYLRSLGKLPWVSRFSHPARDPAENEADMTEDVEKGHKGYAIVWKEYFENFEREGGNPTRVPRPKRGIVRRIRWVLWRDGQLNKCLTTLSTALSNLIQFTDDAFVWHGLAGTGQNENGLDSQKLVKFVQYTRVIQRDFVDTWNILPAQQWAVRLFYPSKEDERDERQRTADMFNLSFTVRVSGVQSKSIQLDWHGWEWPSGATNAPNARTVDQAKEDFVTNEAPTWLVRIPSGTIGAQVSRGEEESRRWSQSLRNVLCAATVDSSLAVDFLKERTDIAQQLGFWLPLLWTTKLTGRLCSCGIRGVVREKNKFAKALDTKFSSNKSLHKLEYNLRSQYFGKKPRLACPSFLTGDLERDSQTEDREKLFATGILLAELIIGKPIINPRLNPEHGNADNDMPVSLQEVSENSFDQYNMRHVIRHCFKSAREMGTRTRSFRGAEGDILSYDEREKFWRTITKP